MNEYQIRISLQRPELKHFIFGTFVGKGKATLLFTEDG